MANTRREYLRRTRKVRMRELHHSVTGWIGLGCGLGSAVLYLVAVILVYRNIEEDLYSVGALGMFGLILSVGGLVLGILGMREKKTRPLPSRFATVVGGGMTLLLVILYLIGL